MDFLILRGEQESRRRSVDMCIGNLEKPIDRSRASRIRVLVYLQAPASQRDARCWLVVELKPTQTGREARGRGVLSTRGL